MAGDRNTQITIETERLLIITRQQPVPAWCDKCGCEVEFVRKSTRTACHKLGVAERKAWRAASSA